MPLLNALARFFMLLFTLTASSSLERSLLFTDLGLVLSPFFCLGLNSTEPSDSLSDNLIPPTGDFGCSAAISPVSGPRIRPDITLATINIMPVWSARYRRVGCWVPSEPVVDFIHDWNRPRTNPCCFSYMSSIFRFRRPSYTFCPQSVIFHLHFRIIQSQLL